MTHLHYRVWDGEQMHYWDDEGLSLTIKSDASWFLWHYADGCVVSSDDRDAALMWGTGEKAEGGREIYDHDALNVFKGSRSFKAIVKFGHYKQDGSGGEYSPTECIGFYAEAINPDQKDEDDCDLIYDYGKKTSLFEFDSIEIIGDVYRNPELLEAAE
ncbi:YopX family protein [Bacillus swezeyi]|uniref:YopX family protein n=1 Tax=Bacillus swezeyi TaxID=1925020 RepID=UPI002E243147|nr:YopX family protein [Bacillus swezeyi]MED2979552.1 YopX family protein [Bacillus swezeyi]